MVFLDGPFECPAGPGVLPFFEGCEPYRTWRMASGVGGIAAPETVTAIDEAMKKQIATTGRPFVGAMGFSQGGTVTAGLLLRQQALNKKSGHVDGLRFGVCLMSSCPPLLMRDESLESSEQIYIPTLHVIGARDDIREMSRDLASKHCAGKSAKLIEFNAGHHMPQGMTDIKVIAEAILELFQKTSQNLSEKD